MLGYNENMKLIGIVMGGLLVVGLLFLGVNTLAVNKIIPLNPVSAIGLPVVTFADVGSFIGGAQNNSSGSAALQGVSQTWRQVQSQLSGVTAQSQIVGQHVQTIVGDRPLIGVASPTTQPASTESAANASTSTTQPSVVPTEEPFYAKTLEYGKYLYCQEVVKDYEARNPALKPTTTP